jgi:hypothetical protein
MSRRSTADEDGTYNSIPPRDSSMSTAGRRRQATMLGGEGTLLSQEQAGTVFVRRLLTLTRQRPSTAEPPPPPPPLPLSPRTQLKADQQVRDSRSEVRPTAPHRSEACQPWDTIV